MSHCRIMIAAVILGIALAPHAVFAQIDSVQDRVFSAKAGAYVNAALEHANAGDNKAALREFDKALALNNLSPYELSTIYQMRGSAHYDLGDYKRAIKSFERALHAGGLNRKEVEDMELNIAQLLIVDKQYENGAKRLELYFREVNEADPKHAELLMSAWIAIEQYERALPWAKLWFESANPKERKHYDVMNFLFHETGQTEEQIKIVKHMVERLPYDATLWQSWASLLVKAEREREAFDVNRLHYETGRVTDEDSIVKLAEYYSYYDMPFEAAQLLEYEINKGHVSKNPQHLVQVADLYAQAREYKRALPILERAAKLDPNSKIHARLGEALYQDQQCERAETALRRAIDLGYDHEKAWSLIGACYYEKAQSTPRLSCQMSSVEIANSPRTQYREKAKAAYKNVRSDGRLASDAKAWVNFIEGEFEAFHNQCIVDYNSLPSTCMLLWEQAYRARVFTGGELIMDEPQCLPYQDEYIAKYRPSEIAKH